MKYSPKYFKDTMPKWKRDKDSFISRYIHRPISFYFSSVFVELGFTSNQVSFISLIIAFLSVILFSSTNMVMLILAYTLLNLWCITDNSDGNIARSVGSKPYGDFIDATSSYFLYGTMFLSLSYSVYKTGGLFFDEKIPEIIILGGIAGSMDTMSRLFFQKMKNNAYEIRIKELQLGIERQEDISRRDHNIIEKFQAKLDTEFTCGGTIHLVLLLICILINAVDLYVVLYFLYGVMTFLATTIYLIKKTGCLRK